MREREMERGGRGWKRGRERGGDRKGERGEMEREGLEGGREGERERERESLVGGSGRSNSSCFRLRVTATDPVLVFVCWLVAYRPSNMRVYLRDGSA